MAFQFLSPKNGPWYQEGDSAECQRYVYDHWSSLSRCLYSDWDLETRTCQVYGRCERHNMFWGCQEVSKDCQQDLFISLKINVGQVMEYVTRSLSDEFMISDAQTQLESCHCQQDMVLNTSSTCHQMMQMITEPMMTTLTSWINDNKDDICRIDGNSATGEYSSILFMSLMIVILLFIN